MNSEQKFFGEYNRTPLPEYCSNRIVIDEDQKLEIPAT